MKKLLSLAALLTLTIAAWAAPTKVNPTVKSATSFAIIIDSDTYSALSAKVEAYRDAVERDGLATYIVSDAWENPEAVKAVISDLYDNAALEGVVFIGHVPVAMLRDAQHLTSAFKMNQTADWKDSSVPSDRFYDDFDLKFDFIKQDSEITDYYYYSLRADSEQHVSSDIYSARVRAEGDEAIAKIGRFLDKAVAAHADRTPLDNMMYLRAHGYNSDALDAWAGEQILVREQLPQLFTKDGKVRFYEHRSAFPLKPYILEQLRNPQLDAAILHHHGAEDTEYYSASLPPNSAQGNVDAIKKYLRSRMRRSKDPEATKASFMESLGVPESWFEMSDSLDAADKAYDDMLDVHLEDIYPAAPQSRFVMQDACYNGSFHYRDCVANAYIFSEGGGTVLVQGNTVNSIQDRLPDRYMGLWAYGVRLGEWARYQQTTIETHLIGDPTLSFTATASAGTDLGAALASHKVKPATWLKLLRKSKAPDVQAIALRKLSDAGYPGICDMLVDKFENSCSGVVRNEALTLIRDKKDPRAVDIVAAAIVDNIELIRRMAAIYAGDMGNAELAPVLANAIIDDKLSKRLVFQGVSSLSQFEPELIQKAVSEAYDAHSNLMEGTGNDKDYYLKYFRSSGERVADDFKTVMDPSVSEKKRSREISYFRNYNYHAMVPQLVAFAEDASQPESCRVTMVEALGWFRYSYNAGLIDAMCERIIASDAPETVRNEAIKTKNRLKEY